MNENYVLRLMHLVETKLPVSQIAPFWEWLANVKYPQDDHSLSQTRAEEIRRSLDSLVSEFERVVKP